MEVIFFMIESLFGNKSVAKILIFLFVNGKCYGTQLHRLLNTSLTPIQKALHRLEKGGIILNYLEGKTKVYQFNPAYPFIEELELLLKKVYTLLPSHEKKDYYVAKDDENLGFSIPKNRKQILLAFWEKLNSTTRLVLNAKNRSKDKINWNRKGKGEVIINKEGQNTIIFREKGTWQGKEGEELSFSNIFRWTLDIEIGMICLEHLRLGIDQPVLLLQLVPSSYQTLSSADSHLCGEDTYLGQIYFDQTSFRLNWRVIGPKKDEEIVYYYS
ncbi:MAG: hypothetical protein K0S74_1367 [Chlamydiales bacterium]|jgi:hypothetical protein|nr:hypothetical protein [Chlamydiales bacterium]